MSTTTPLTALPALLKAAGLSVYEVPGWESRSAGSYGPWLGVLNHHTCGPISSRTLTPSLNICINGRSDLSGPLCNIYGGRDRKLYMVAAGRANHAGSGRLSGIPSGNGNLVGIEWENTGVGEPWTDLLPVMVVTNAVICDYLQVNRDNAWDHREWTTRKIDRFGISSSDFRSLVTAWRPTTSPAVTPASTGAFTVSEAADVLAEIKALRQEEKDRYKVDADREKVAGQRHAALVDALHAVALRLEALAQPPANL